MLSADATNSGMYGKLTDVADIQSHEIQIIKFLSDIVSNKYVIDVGSHHGSFIKPLLEAGWEGVAFEPLEANRAIISKELSGFARLRISNKAVSSSSGVKDFHLAVNKDGTAHEYYHSLAKVGNGVNDFCVTNDIDPMGANRCFAVATKLTPHVICQAGLSVKID
jgi:FkbM family methyltransferase